MWSFMGQGSPSPGVAERAESKVPCNLISCWWSCWIYESVILRMVLKSGFVFFFFFGLVYIDSWFHICFSHLYSLPTPFLKRKLKFWIVWTRSIYVFQFKGQFCLLVCFWLLLAGKIYLCVCVRVCCIVYIHIVFMYVCTQNTGHATKEVSQPFTEAHKPQRGAQRMSAWVFDGICRFWRQILYGRGEWTPDPEPMGRPSGTIHMKQSPNSVQPQAPTPRGDQWDRQRTILENLQTGNIFARWKQLWIPGVWHRQGGPFLKPVEKLITYKVQNAAQPLFSLPPRNPNLLLRQWLWKPLQFFPPCFLALLFLP